MAAPASATDSGIVSLRDLVDFVSHVADCYPEITRRFSDELAEILTLHHTVLEPELREKLVGSLVLLRRKEIIDSSRYVAVAPMSTFGPTDWEQTVTYLLSHSDCDTEQIASSLALSEDPVRPSNIECQDYKS